MKILISEPLAQEGIDLLKEYADVDVKTKLTADELKSIIGQYEALVVRSQTQVTKEIIEAGERLVVVGRAGVGVDNIDIVAATAKGIIVVNAPTGNTISAAEHTIALMMALARNIPQANASLKAGQWRRNDFIGIEVRGKTIGLIGLGNVGSEVAKRARGLEMKVLAFDPFISKERAANLQVEIVTLEEVLRNSDFISLHVPLTEQTRGMINEQALSMVKPMARLINTARGDLINEEALAKAIREKRLAGAAIDVFSKEPCTDSIVFSYENIIVTPHLGASTNEAQSRAAVEVAKQIIDVLNGKPARYAVNFPFIAPDALPIIGPFLEVAYDVGSLARQLCGGQIKEIKIKYSGEIASFDTNALKASVLRGVLEGISEERVNLVNANIVAARYGITILEQKDPVCENYTNLITTEVRDGDSTIIVAGTLIRGEVHIVQVKNYWVDVIPTGGYFLFSEHLDRPGLIGAVGKIAGDANINISYMHLSRLKPRGQALMILALDEPLSEEAKKEILSLRDVYTAKVVKL